MSNRQSIKTFETLAPGVRRLVAPNPSIMTGPGTNTYLIGKNELAILDPGPNINSHIAMIQKIAAGSIKWIVVTHTHLDHSPAAYKLAKSTGAQLLGKKAPAGTKQDHKFLPNRELNDGDQLETNEFTLTAIHTPGHASNHLCYMHKTLQWIFTGDHVMNGSTVVINPPDGNMKDYLDSLARLKKFNPVKLAPGHGDLLSDPETSLDWVIKHRLKREEKVLSSLRSNPPAFIADLVKIVYNDINEKLHSIAERSLLAHLIKLEKENHVYNKDGLWNIAKDQQ